MNYEEHKKAAMTSKLPSLLRLKPDGTLFCTDGRDVKEYMSSWANAAKVTEETSINIMRSDSHQAERDDAFLFRNIGC